MMCRLLVALSCVSGLSTLSSAHAADAITESQASFREPPATVAALDVPRYMGIWYEIAKFPNRFQKQCVGHARAEYALQSNGRVKVINRCKLENGETSEAIGVARQTGPATSPKFEVRFAPAWLSFIPAVWGDYWVIDLDPAYRLVAVSEPDREFLWVLSRTPKVEQQDYEELLKRLSRKGFDVQKLVPTRQDNGTAN